jgi:hypothetical protein
MIPSCHPLFFFSGLFSKANSIFSFSKYIYTPDSLFDERETLRVGGSEVTEVWLSEQLAGLSKYQELAFHSNVLVGGRVFHIPMIDFSLEKVEAGEIFDRLNKYLPKKILLNLAIYSSGRSFHAYSTTLLGPKEWIEFMGRILLVNPRSCTDVIDSRWVGHRLIGGFGALRWSNNSGSYLSLPTRISYP